jgi:hypothetical protein
MRAVVVLLCLTASLHADEDRFAKVLESLKAAKAERVQAAQENVDGLIKRKAGAVPIRKARAELEAAKKADEATIPELIPLPLAVGGVGPLGRIKIDQVAGAMDMRATMHVPVAVARGYITQEHPLWITGWPTAGKADSRIEETTGVFIVTGTKTYTTALGGSNTMMVVEPFDAKAFQAWRKSKK